MSEDVYYDEGKYAYLSGIPREDNPYDDIQAEQWDDGWCDAEDDDMANRNATP